jgi:hypothetical protein
MRPDTNLTSIGQRNLPWSGIVKVAFLIVLFAIMFLLGRDMVRHRFFRGGWVNQHGVLKP